MSSANQEIDTQAADWAARRELRPLTPEEAEEFDSWLGTDIRHLGAYGRAEAVLARLERVHASTVLDRDTVPTNAPPLTTRRTVMAGSAAASFAVIAAISLGHRRVVDQPKTRLAQSVNLPEEHFGTALGEKHEIRLSDGSTMTLNTSTRIIVRYSDQAREIHLVQGEALFDVAKNKHRPFIVTVGDTKVRAVGTSFTVSMLPEKPILVLVKEGVVELQRASMTVPVRASANVQVLAPSDAPIATVAVPAAQVERDLAWQYGKIAFDNQPLKEAANEFARYSEVRIVVDPEVADRTVTGLFVSSDPIGFAKAAASVLKLKVSVKEHEVRIFPS